MGPFPEFRRTLIWYSQQGMFLINNIYIVCAVPECFPSDILLWLLLSFLPIWNGSAMNMQIDPSADTGMMPPMSHVCHKTPIFWSCPSKGLRHFWLQICIGHRKQHVGWTRKKKILFSFSVWHLPGGRKCRARWKSYCWNSDQSVIKCHDLICQRRSHFQGQSLHLCMRVCVCACVVSLCL